MAADPTKGGKGDKVADDVVDSVTQSNIAVVGDAPAVSLATMYQSLAHSSILAMQNAVQQQQNTWTVQMAVTAKLVKQILGEDPVGGDPLFDLFDDLDDLDGFEDEDDLEDF